MNWMTNLCYSKAWHRLVYRLGTVWHARSLHRPCRGWQEWSLPVGVKMLNISCNVVSFHKQFPFLLPCSIPKDWVRAAGCHRYAREGHERVQQVPAGRNRIRMRFALQQRCCTRRGTPRVCSISYHFSAVGIYSIFGETMQKRCNRVYTQQKSNSLPLIRLCHVLHWSRVNANNYVC